MWKYTNHSAWIEPPAFPPASTHQRVRIITADVQGAIRQVKPSETAGSLWKGESRTVMLESAQHSPHLQDVTEPQMRHGMKGGQETMRKKTHDSCHKETPLSLPLHRPLGQRPHQRSQIPWRYKDQLVKKQKYDKKTIHRLTAPSVRRLATDCPSQSPDGKLHSHGKEGSRVPWRVLETQVWNPLALPLIDGRPYEQTLLFSFKSLGRGKIGYVYSSPIRPRGLLTHCFPDLAKNSGKFPL